MFLLLLAPASWAFDTLGHATSGTFPAGGPTTVAIGALPGGPGLADRPVAPPPRLAQAVQSGRVRWVLVSGTLYDLAGKAAALLAQA